MVQYFIHRPVFAWVLAIVTMLAGGFALTQLAVSQYPDIAPTTVSISATYSGATAQAVQNSVTMEIEDGLTGIEGVLYTESSSSEGSSSISLTFDDSIDPVDAQNEVQTRVAQVESRLPTSVQTSGVSVRRSTSSILMVGAIVSADNRYSTVELGNILAETVEGPVQRTEGVGNINSFGSGYAMRVWLDPLKLAQYQLTPSDVTAAVAAQNTTVSVGSLGKQPTVTGQQFTANITAQSQLTSVTEFENILLKTAEDGASVTLADVAKIEIGQESYGSDSIFSGANAAGFGVNLATGANAVDTAAAVREVLQGLSASLPEGVTIETAYDTSPFVELSIEQVKWALFEAILLVLAVILLFLQKWRATLIPIIAVPVVLLGTFAVLWVAGYSINTLTMFAMVLAIGLLVDDAIIVVENVERLMEEEKLSALAATEKSMGQITGALIGLALVLCAVFLPMAFFAGSTGIIYRQFSITIITAMILSAAVALILTPALCATMLRPHGDKALIAPARWFNRGFDRFTSGYVKVVTRSLSRPILMLGVLALIIGGAALIYPKITSSFLPAEDQGVLMAMVSLQEGATTQQTRVALDEIEDYMLNTEKESVSSTFSALGFGFNGSGQNSAMTFIRLRDFDDRQDASLAASALAARANRHFAGYRAGQVIFMQPPAIPGLGNSSGFSMYLVDQANNGAEALTEAANQLIASAAGTAELENVRATGLEQKAALRITIDQQKAESFGISVSDINAILSVIFSGTEVNDFALGSSLRPVIVTAAAEHRMQPEDIEAWYARNSSGEMVPFPSFLTTSWEPVANALARIDGVNAVSISGSQSSASSSGVAMEKMEELVAALPGGYGASWTGLAYQERQSGNQAPYLYALSVLVVFLCLAALYESWSIPLAVMLAVPVGVFGALLATWLFDQANDVYFKVGMLTTIGLAARNAILIVEFANDLQARGMALVEAATTAARQRLRPILMTSMAFMLGVVPLATATGAGAAAQKSIGIGVLGGMISATILGIFVVPAFYVVIRRIMPAKIPASETPS
ncbi:MAG: efflux RND transporter permease subunit [Hoeflea sp.]|uniref:efflux RND transporter permease subunit n=1 Tax=Hoeflea sp. TaxID=1940281 RepID=UPI001DE3C3A5|nr:efflux RND transporter permease subunit [Hoeflea sp.]MBU4529248.1 efflux RND transporter permease subunit [Alphaproteobacteria bacterium]MBU4543652.1 efflux RND transporter permease subunit [Alphaproteobacteria bacterium]MBU4549278.1 efflux RND transporter permease subunit [Alphaproteobacteria bacterium]MBV1725411.1 efflux RND transporter permease subunit [Hoeflea sp.]MBV1785374.1 efflux RND transporter permease subunit [Hoeflea sp.]